MALVVLVATVTLGDCLDELAKMEDCSIDAIVTDPPYGLGFMGKAWDDLPPGLPWAQECLRVLKPGGYLLAFGGSRTWHRLAVAVEDAGFEIRDSIAWLYGSGFPKSLDVSKAIDKAAGVTFSASPASGVGFMNAEGRDGYNVTQNKLTRSGDSTPDAEKWQGWGTALKPAFEPIVVGRKPLVGTVAANVLAHGTGALNIGGCRVEGDGAKRWETPRGGIWTTDSEATSRLVDSNQGRWPANVVLDGSQADALDVEVDASKFFPTFRYQAKAPASERPKVDGIAHATVKPLALMRWLVRLVTPPGGVVLDTFAGSGATLEAAILEGFDCIGIEREADYIPLINVRVERSVAIMHAEALAAAIASAPDFDVWDVQV